MCPFFRRSGQLGEPPRLAETGKLDVFEALRLFDVSDSCPIGVRFAFAAVRLPSALVRFQSALGSLPAAAAQRLGGLLAGLARSLSGACGAAAGLGGVDCQRTNVNTRIVSLRGVKVNRRFLYKIRSIVLSELAAVRPMCNPARAASF